MPRNFEERLMMSGKGAIGFAALSLVSVNMAWHAVLGGSLPEAYQFAAAGSGALAGSILGWRSVRQVG